MRIFNEPEQRSNRESKSEVQNKQVNGKSSRLRTLNMDSKSVKVNVKGFLRYLTQLNSSRLNPLNI